jgi:hypothetical protein
MGSVAEGASITESGPGGAEPQTGDGVWIVLAASATGPSHVADGLPCQDAYHVRQIDGDCGVVALADGAGSCAASDIGARMVVEQATRQVPEALAAAGYELGVREPGLLVWHEIAFDCIMRIGEEVRVLAASTSRPFEAFSSTLIIVVYSPLGLLVTHVGDGRAGWRDRHGTWRSMIRPFRGRYANETVFLTTVCDVGWPEAELLVESRVVRAEPTAFVLMSDGCERSAFECRIFDERTGSYHDPNRPYAPWLEPKVDFAHRLAVSGAPLERGNEVLAQYLASGGGRLGQEPDDKTLVLGVRARPRTPWTPESGTEVRRPEERCP